ncbi:adenosylcobinamide-GDP ribazoletransferase [Ramlibacter sp. PS4R-6]|uniref:adenosylcobinamide-GDP ribazoletransferase n=1 Tax=Ramlibacter sp. PS4R-6 TaxID=3133438 RepID=UPI0030A902E2
MDLLRQYLVAVQFFTRVPVTGPLAQWADWSPEQLRASAAHFPGVGWLVALVACMAFALLGVVLHGSVFVPLVAAIGCTIATLLLTGAFHEDGLADVADGLGGSAGREQALAIMKDSRLGTYGVVAVAMALLMKVALLAVLGGQSAAGVLVALFAAHTVSRFAPLVVTSRLPYIGDESTSKSKPLADRIGKRELWIAAMWCVPPLALAVVVRGFAFAIFGVLLVAAAWWAMQRLFVRRLQGFTGDCLGATQQVCEIAFYLGAAIAFAFG